MRLLSFLCVLLLLAVVVAADDDAIYDLVRKRLYDDPEVKGYNINIEVRDGVVTLNGRVASEKIRARAEKITRKVSGVKKVINKLQVGEEKPA